MADRTSRSRDKPSKRSTSKSSKSRSRSRHKQHKLRNTKHASENDTTLSKREKNRELISSYEPSQHIKNELEQLLRKDHSEYMNKKKEAHNKISSILNSMTPKQEQRFECWNRSVIPKNVVKSIMNNVLNRNASNTSRKKSKVDDKSVIVMQALSKCLVMELVSKAREIQKETITNYITQQNTNTNKQNDAPMNDASGDIEDTTIAYPPLMMDDGDDAEEKAIKEHSTEKDNNEDVLIGIDVLNDSKQKDDKDTKEETDTPLKLNEQFVLGAIRPVHIREA
eukprot:105335_1